MNPSTALILSHLGGINRLRELLNVSFFLSYQHGVRFHYSGSMRYNAVCIEIVSVKIYNMKFYSVIREGKKFIPMNEKALFGLCSDELLNVFEQETGLLLM